MSRCPECEKEYPDEMFTSVYQTDDEALKDRIVKYLLHCGRQIREEASEEETEDGRQTFYSVLVPTEEEKEARKEIKTVLAYDEKQENGEEGNSRQKKAPEPSTLYVDAKERYQEYKSSGIMFLVFAVVFLVFGILNCSGMINVMASTVSLIIIFGGAALFLYVGITSLMKISSLKEEASAEEAATDLIYAYLKEQFPKEAVEKINKSKMTGEEITGERLYFLQMETMKEALVNKFPDKEENYLDALLEDYYNTLEL